jgi:hypothetical protein
VLAALIRTDASGVPWGVYVLSCDAAQNGALTTILHSFSIR